MRKILDKFDYQIMFLKQLDKNFNSKIVNFVHNVLKKKPSELYFWKNVNVLT